MFLRSSSFKPAKKDCHCLQLHLLQLLKQLVKVLSGSVFHAFESHTMAEGIDIAG